MAAKKEKEPTILFTITKNNKITLAYSFPDLKEEFAESLDYNCLRGSGISNWEENHYQIDLNQIIKNDNAKVEILDKDTEWDLLDKIIDPCDEFWSITTSIYNECSNYFDDSLGKNNLVGGEHYFTRYCGLMIKVYDINDNLIFEKFFENFLGQIHWGP